MTLATSSDDTEIGWKIAVALSGGGHRASLFNLGVLLALVDLRLNRHVSYVASVSGGSITNAFVGLQCEFDKETPDSFQEVARKFVSVIVNRGIVTSRLICAFVSILLFPSALFVAGLILGMFELTLRNGVVLTAIVVFMSLALALLRGRIVEWLLATRLFSNANSQLRFKDFKSKNVEHVLCCTELASGRPIYFSSAEGGRILIRLAEDERTAFFGQSHLIKSCAELPVAAAVRSSAAFPPGISPRRLTIRSLADAESASQSPSPPNGAVDWPLFVSDGGVWNNLATQALLEDSILKGSNAAFFKPEVVLVANASAAFRSVRSWPFHVPGWAELKAVLQAIWIQNRNTVEPRLASFRDRLRYRLKNELGPDSVDPLIVPIDLSKSVAETTADFRTETSADIYSERSAEFREWTKILVSKLSDWKAKADKAPSPLDATNLYELVREQFIYKPDTHGTDTEYIRKFNDSYRQFEADLTGCDLPKIPTTLDRIDKHDAMALLARGYANTHAVAYCMNLVDTLEIKMTREQLERLTSPSQSS